MERGTTTKNGKFTKTTANELVFCFTDASLNGNAVDGFRYDVTCTRKVTRQLHKLRYIGIPSYRGREEKETSL